MYSYTHTYTYTYGLTRCIFINPYLSISIYLSIYLYRTVRIEKRVRKRLGQLSLSDSSRAKEHHAGGGLGGVVQTGAGTLNGL